MSTPTLDRFTRAYLECALWTSDPDPGSGEWAPHDDWTIDNIDPDAITQAIKDCARFQRENRADLDEVSDVFHVDDDQHGHDFWLTRNGHGRGFWDRDYGPLGEALTRAAHAFGNVDVIGPETQDNGSCSEAQWDAWDGVIYFS